MSLHWQLGRLPESAPVVSMGTMQVPLLQPPQSSSSRIRWTAEFAGWARCDGITLTEVCVVCQGDSRMALFLSNLIRANFAGVEGITLYNVRSFQKDTDWSIPKNTNRRSHLHK